VVSFGGGKERRPASLTRGRGSSDFVWTAHFERAKGIGEARSFSIFSAPQEAPGMIRLRYATLIFIVSLTALSGCGLLSTDQPPTGGRFSVSYSPDPTQPSWHRLLFGTRWIGEGPPQ
jgi:hypothetical protein